LINRKLLFNRIRAFILEKDLLNDVN
jgi:hypothetical protein